MFYLMHNNIDEIEHLSLREHINRYPKFYKLLLITGIITLIYMTLLILYASINGCRYGIKDYPRCF